MTVIGIDLVAPGPGQSCACDLDGVDTGPHGVQVELTLGIGKLMPLFRRYTPVPMQPFQHHDPSLELGYGLVSGRVKHNAS